MDGDLGMIYLLRDNETLASDRRLARDHDLVKRTHTMSILVDDSRTRDERRGGVRERRSHPGKPGVQEDTTMQMTLRPGEALVWRWGHLKPAKYMSPNQFVYQDNICNGLWEYRPDFVGEVWTKGALRVENVASGPEGLAAEKRQDGYGRVEDHQSHLRRRASRNGSQWGEVAVFV